MPSPLHVLAVGLVDAEATQLSASLLASGFAPAVQRTSETTEATAGLDASFDVVVLGAGVAAESREQLADQVRARRLPAYVIGLTELLSKDPGCEGSLGARLSGVLARRAHDDRAGGQDAVSLMAVLNTGPCEVLVLDAQTLRIKYANDEAVRNCGFSRKRLLSMRAFELAPALGEEGYQCAVRPLGTRERDVVSFEAEHRRSDGSVYPIAFSVRWTQRGREAIYVAIGQDLTGLRRLERERDRHRLALDASRDGILIVGEAGEILEANEAAAHLYRRTVPELVASRVQDLVAQDLVPSTPEQVQNVVHRRKDGTRFDAEVLQRAVEANGERLGVLVVRDVSSTRRLALAEQDAADSLRTFMQAAPDPTMMLDSAGRVTSWSQSAERLFGWAAEDVVGHVPPITPPDREQEWQTLLRLADEGNSLGPLQVTRRRRDGVRLDVRLSMAPLRGRAGRSRGIVAVMTDVAEQGRVEVERAHLTAALDGISDEVYLVEPGTMRVRFANAAAARACGVAPQSMVAFSWLDVESDQAAAHFAVVSGAGVCDDAPSRSTWLKDLGGGGDARPRRVRVTTTEHGGISVHIVVASEQSGPFVDASDPALRVAGLGQLHVHSDGTILSIDPVAVELLGASCPSDSSIAELAGLSGAPELLDIWHTLDRELEVHTTCSTSGGARRLIVSAFRASDALRTFVLGPRRGDAPDEVGVDLALQSLATGELDPALEATCEVIRVDTEARAVWLAIREEPGAPLRLVTSSRTEARVATAVAARLRSWTSFVPEDVLTLGEELRGLGLGDVVLRGIDGAEGRTGLIAAHVRESEVERTGRVLEVRAKLIEAVIATSRASRAGRSLAAAEQTSRRVAPEPVLAGLDALPTAPGEWNAAIGVALDRFWELTAVLGPGGADSALAALVARARRALPERTVVVRTKRDVIVALLAIEPPADIDELALALRSALSAPLVIDGVHEVRLEVTTTVVTGTRDPQALALGVDAGLATQGSEQSRGPRHVTAPVTDTALQQQAREQALRHALARDEVAVSWEPEVDLATGAVVAYVAVPAWTDGTGLTLTGEPLAQLANRADPVAWLEALARSARPVAEAAHSGCRVVLPIVGASGSHAGALRRILGGAAEMVSLELTPGASVAPAEAAAPGVRTRVEVGEALDVEAWARAAVEGVVVRPHAFTSVEPHSGARASFEACVAATRALMVPLVAAGVETAEQLEAARAGGCTRARGPGLEGSRLTAVEVCARLAASAAAP